MESGRRSYPGTATWIPASLILLISVVWAVASAGFPFIGDDLFFSLRASELPGGLLDVPRNMASKFLSNNGRLGDISNALWLYFLPRQGLNILCGAFLLLLYMVVIKASGARTLLSRVLLIAVICMGLTWWDLFLMFVIQINYIWGAALAVFTIMILLDREASRTLKIIAALIAFPAAAWHEMAGSPLAAGLIVWLLYDRRRLRSLSRTDKTIIVLFLIGSLIPYLSPMLWGRLGSGNTPDDSYLMILLKSNYLPLGLTVAAICMPRRVAKLMSSPWLVWAVAAWISMLVSPLGGVLGRSGWFGQIYALIALWPLLKVDSWQFKFSGWLTAVIAAVIVIHNYEFLHWQCIRNSELHSIIDSFRAHPDRPVYIDLTGYEDVPAIVVGKSAQPLTNEYFNYRHSPGNRYFDGRYLLTILPTAIKSVDLGELKGLKSVGDGYICDSLPVDTDSEGWFDSRDGREWIAVEFSRDNRSLYYIAPRRFIPGLRPAARPLPVAHDFPPSVAQ